MMMQESNQIAGNECPYGSTELILYLYGELEDKKEFEGHLVSCEFCKRTLAEYKSALEIYRNDSVRAPAIELKRERSFLDKVSRFKVRPAYLGVSALMILIILSLLIYFTGAGFNPTRSANGASYSWIIAELDELEYEVDNLMSFNISDYEVNQLFMQSEEGISDELPEGDVTDVLLDELDELQTNMTSF